MKSRSCPFQSSGVVWKSRWPSWAPVPNKPTISVDVKQHTSIVRWRPLAVFPGSTTRLNDTKTLSADDHYLAVFPGCTTLTITCCFPGPHNTCKWHQDLVRWRSLAVSPDSADSHHYTEYSPSLWTPCWCGNSTTRLPWQRGLNRTHNLVVRRSVVITSSKHQMVFTPKF